MKCMGFSNGVTKWFECYLSKRMFSVHVENNIRTYKDINIIEHLLNRNFPNICDWFVDNNLSIHFSEDKTKFILFAPLNKCKKLRKLNVSCGSLKIKQYSEVTYLGCILDESL